MKRMIKAHLAVVTFLAAAIPALGFATSKDDAVALAQKAVAHVKEVGIDKACKDFAVAGGEYFKGELYVFLQDKNSLMICHAAIPRTNGHNVSDIKDANGKFFAKEQTAMVMSKGSGWIDYVFANPVTHSMENKSSYGLKIDGEHWLGVGVYRK
ncbi:cache domain-containing protein [Noviherbaspirillum sp.]|uniref:cache domain-containing protein n=1 Tax=Noviherbaspirillum sp. TaxID=1926288 RepID=UPI002B471C53|nr:cache domain-containing protein [Noviherbaspirillum sp.]HJV81560.1 cache domain-containing protein [Noviherbaspirillum sp.]